MKGRRKIPLFMRHPASIILLTFVVLLLAMILLKAGSRGQPRIVFDEVSFIAPPLSDADGRMVVHSFNFRNAGQGDLKILGVSTTCGCTVAAPEKAVYSSGERGSITARMSLPAVGSNRVAITVATNARPNTVRLILAGTFRPQRSIAFEPSHITLSGAEGKAGTNLRVEALGLHQADDVSVLYTSSKRGTVEAKLARRVARPLQTQLGYYRTTFEFQVSPSPNVQGEINDVLSIKLSPPFGNINVPVSGSNLRQGDISIRPEKAIFVVSRNRPADPLPILVSVVGAGKILALETIRNPYNQWLEASVILPTGEEHRAQIVLTPKSMPSQAVFDATIDLELKTESGMKSLSIPVVVRLLP